jgi:hypothetical protein
MAPLALPLALALEPMSGPFASRKLACAACTVDRPAPTPEGALSAEVWADTSYHPVGPEGSLVSYTLAIRTPAGWFTRSLGQSGTQCGGDAPFSVWWWHKSTETWSTPTGNRLVLRANVGAEVSQVQVVICGVGAASRAPECAELFPSGDARADIPAWDTPFALQPDGTLTLGERQYRPEWR